MYGETERGGMKEGGDGVRERGGRRGERRERGEQGRG